MDKIHVRIKLLAFIGFFFLFDSVFAATTKGKTNVLWIFIENASCHIAIGRAYQMTMHGGDTMSTEDFEAAGGNNSLVHVDFMIGSDKLDIDGITKDGKSEPVLHQGEWAFDV